MKVKGPRTTFGLISEIRSVADGALRPADRLLWGRLGRWESRSVRMVTGICVAGVSVGVVDVGEAR